MTDILQKLDAVGKAIEDGIKAASESHWDTLSIREALSYIPEIRAALEGMQKGVIGELIECDFFGEEDIKLLFSIKGNLLFNGAPYLIIPTPPKGGSDGNP